MPKLADDDAAARAANPAGGDFSEALARGLAVIGAFGPQSRALTLSDVARQVQLPRATVRRALLTLVHLGYAEENGRLFSLTPRVLGLAGAYLGSSVVSAVLQPACARLAAAYGETVSVAVLDQDMAMMVAYARPRAAYMESGGVGLRIPAFCSAVGRVLLAGLPAVKRQAYFADLQPVAQTPRTVTDKDALEVLVQRADQEGFALADEEAELGFRSLAVPLRNLSGEVAFALNVGAPVGRMTADAMQALYWPRLRDEAAQLQRQLL